MCVQTLAAEATVEAFNEGIVSRFAWAREVQNDVVYICPQIHVPADKFATVIDPDRLGIADLATDTLKGLNHILALVTEARVCCW